MRSSHRLRRLSSAPRSHRAGGFTLFEVLAAVLILGLFYTVLADRAIRGLRSEGMDRRRTEAAALADARLVDFESAIAAGAPLEPMSDEVEQGDYRVLLEVLPEDIDALLPPPDPETKDGRSEPATRLLVDERGESRVYRLQVVVSWDEAGEPQQLQRTSWDFDQSQLAMLFPGEGGSTGASEGGRDGDEASGGGSESASRSSEGRDPLTGSSGGNDPEACVKLQNIDEILRCLSEIGP